MRRVLAGCGALALGLAGCGGIVPPAAEAPLQFTASFPPRGLVDTLHIEIVEQQPLRAAVLVAPNGVETPASDIDVIASPQAASGQLVGGNPWQTALLGGSGAATAGFVPSHPLAQAGPRGREQLLATASTAELPLPDPAAYRRDWQRYRVRLTFGTAPNLETREFAAPQPPPQAAAPSR